MEVPRIISIEVEGLKSLAKPTTVNLRPLTLLAGANSSGKSSIMQALLLLKQTIESQADAGSLRLDGSHVQFSSVEQMLSRINGQVGELKIGFRLESGNALLSSFSPSSNRGLELTEQLLGVPGYDRTLHRGMSHRQLLEIFGLPRLEAYAQILDVDPRALRLSVKQDRCFLEVVAISSRTEMPFTLSLRRDSQAMSEVLERILHVPGLRGLPSRVYPLLAANGRFAGRFDPYTASVILHWQDEGASQLRTLAKWLNHLDLTGTIRAVSTDDTQVELQVGRTRTKSSKDYVNIADVGIGTSQVLPVLVALLIAEPGRLVYLEQPELHLHPRAQVRLADVLVESALRGVQVVVETHSSLLLTGIQTGVARHRLPAENVSLNWFSRNKSGVTQVAAGILDSLGRFGNWPIDFDEVQLHAEDEYLSAAEQLA